MDACGGEWYRRCRLDSLGSIMGCRTQLSIVVATLLGVSLVLAGAPSGDAAKKAREAMVRDQIAARGVKDTRVLDAMRKVPRHALVPADYRRFAYADHPLPIGEDQTISQPYIVAFMTEQLRFLHVDQETLRGDFAAAIERIGVTA